MRIRFAQVVISFSVWGMGCMTVPSVSHRKYEFPKNSVFLEMPTAPRGHVIEKLGLVRAKVNFPSFDPERPEVEGDTYCRNYYNQAALQLLKFSQDKGGNAVANVRSVVFYLDGKHELFKAPECSDDGAEGQILLQGIAIRYKKVVVAE